MAKKKHYCYECGEPFEEGEDVEMIKVDGHPQPFHPLGCAENYRDNLELFKEPESLDH